MTLSNPSNATISDATAKGTIENDDEAALDVLVSNYPDGSGSDFSLNFVQSGNSQRHYIAQTFTADAGFTLTAVDIPFRRVPDNSRVAVSLHVLNGSKPGTYLAGLDLSGALAVGDNTFAAPAGTALADGSYFVRVRWRSGDTNNLLMTDGPDDETSAESGWSIEDRSHYSASGSSWSNWNQQFAMRVRGTIDGVPRVATGGVRIESDPDAHDSYGVGEEIEVAVGFTDDVTVDTMSGTPRVELTVGSNTRYADYSASDSSADELAFLYEVTADDHDQDGVSIDADALELNGGAIHKDGDTSTNAVLGHAALDADSDHRVNRDPFIVSDGVSVISDPQLAADTYGLGEVIEIEVEFSAAVDAATGTDFVLSVSGPKRAPLLRGSGTKKLVFGYTVVASDDDDSGIWIGEQDRTLVGNREGYPQNGEITSAVTDRAADLDHDSPGVLSGHKVDGSRTTGNVAPSFSSSATFDAAENQFTAGTVLATDSDADDEITGYAITGGADQAFFSSVTNGLLTFDAAPNYEDAQDQGTNNTYVVDVTATSGAGTRVMTATQTITVTVTDVAEQSAKPAKPVLAKVTGSTTSLTATWEAPGKNGGPAITGYKLEYRAAPAGTWMDFAHTGTGVTATITGLTADTSYQARVLAENGETDSDWSDASDAVSTNAAAALPTLSIGNASATEGSLISFPLTLSATASENVTVTCTASLASGDTGETDDLALGSARDGIVLAGQTAGICTIPTSSDTTDEDDETFTVTLSGVSSNAQLAADPTAKGTILDDDDPVDDCPDDTTTTCAVDVGGSATGNIDADTDFDWFKVELEAGTRYQIDLEGADTGRGTLPDPWLGRIIDVTITDVDNSGDRDGGVNSNSRAIFTPTADGIHYVEVSADVLDGPRQPGTYTLSVIVLGANGASEADTDFPETTATTGRVEVGASVTGTIGADNDDDWFRVDLEAGKTYQFDLEGADTGRGTQPDPYVVLNNPSATTELEFDSDGGLGKNARLIYTADATGTHYVDAATGSDEQGTYTLSVRDVTPPDDLPANVSTTGTVEVDGSAVRGDIYRPVFVERTGDDDVDGYDFDTDWFAVELEEDKTYRIDMWGHNAGNDLTLRLPQINAIYNEDGEFLVNTFDSDESDYHYLFRVTFHAYDDGAYYIAASGESFEWGTYKLRVNDTEDDDEDVPVSQRGPKNLRAVEEKGGVRLTWQSPDGAAVTGYRIERRRADGQGSGPQRSHGQPRDHHTLVEDTGNTETSYVDESAEQGVEYEYRVTARNESGPGESSDWVRAGPEEEPVWGDGLPGAPRNLTATPGNREVTLSWDPPDDNGNAPATRYRIEWRVDGKDYDRNDWGTAQETTYTTNDQANLANGVKYFFRVKAENDDGNSYGPYGPASEEVSATPTSGSAVDLGTPVLSDTEDLHHGMVKLDWQDIEDAGWYVVQYYHVEGGEWLDLPAEGVDIAFHGSSAVVSNLHGLSWLRVRAMSCAGASEWSQIEQLFGTNESDWEGVPVPEVAEGDEIEPCPVVLGTPVLSETEDLHHGMVQLDWEDIEDAGWYVVQYYRLEDGEWLDLPAEGVDIAFHGSSAVVSNLHGLSWLRVGAASCDGESEWSQIEQLFGTNASDWEGVPVPEVEEGDEIEPCDEDPDTPDNSPATGAPTISGTAQVGETLTANTSGVIDADGLSNVQYKYQWLADDSDISGATNATYTLAAGDEGKAIKVEVSFTDDAGNEETLTSAATDAVEAAPTPNSPATGAPTISGTAQVGETLTANTSGIADADGLGNVQYEYQWLADDADTSGATNATYTLAAADEGKAISVQVSFTDDAGNNEALTSATTDAVEAAPTPNRPATGAPTISGTAQVGETLTANTSGIADEDGLGNVQYEYQWLADAAEIAGATSSTYTLADTDEGKVIKVEVSFTDDEGNAESLTSAATDAVAAGSIPNSPATGAPTISGTVQVAETLEADTSGIADADGLSSVQYEYQWLADDAEIAGATSLTYTLAAADEGKAIKVLVSFTDDAGNEETLTSAATDAVAAAPTPNSPATGAPTISGTAQVGETLTADTSDIADEDGLGNVQYEYQWLADDSDISGATNATYTLAAADEGKAIKVQITFTDDAGNAETLTSAATDAVAAEPSEPPDKPKGLDATATHDAITLTWDDPQDDSITGYVILRRLRVNDQGGDFSVLVANTESAAATYTDNTVAASTTYTYRIKAINEHGVSERSRWVHIDTPAPPVPDQPTGLEATVSNGQVVLTWDDPDDESITGYVILRRVRVNDEGGDFSVLVADTGSAATTYTDDTVAAGTTYTYRIKAINEHGTSERSRWYHISTPAAP